MKVVLEVNQSEIKAKLEQLQSYLPVLNNAEEIKRKYLCSTASELLEMHKAKSEFKNDGLVLELYNLTEDYNTLLKFEQIDKTYFTFSKDIWIISSDNIKAIEDAHTIYLSEDDAKLYLKLDKLCTQLNELNGADRFIQKSLDGYSVNKIRLHNKL